jgi:hypothetical protein
MVKMNARRSMWEARPVVTLARALCDEYREIHGEDVPQATDHSIDAVERAYRLAAAAKDQAALCLSGGRIRSAAFSLGVIQALARKGLLARLQYLSTVSGGGYAGAWLSAVIHDTGGDVEAVQKLLACPEARPQLSNLRNYPNYLTPQPGLASPDAWTGIMLWVRNVPINWIIFVPALFALTMAPIFYRDLIGLVTPGPDWLLFVIGLISLGVAVYLGASRLPSHLSPARAATVARSRSGESRGPVRGALNCLAALEPRDDGEPGDGSKAPFNSAFRLGSRVCVCYHQNLTLAYIKAIYRISD